MKCKNCGGALRYYSEDGYRKGKLDHYPTITFSSAWRPCKSPEPSEADAARLLLNKYDDELKGHFS